MYNGKLIGDLFDAVERAQSPVGRHGPQNDSAITPAEISPASGSAEPLAIRPVKPRPFKPQAIEEIL